MFIIRCVVYYFTSQNSVVYSWRAYDNLRFLGMGYRHRVVTHCREFVNRQDPENPVHTNTVEGRWGLVKERIKAMHGVDLKSGVNLVLHECSWKSRVGVRDNVMREILLLVTKDNPSDDLGPHVSMGELADGPRAV